MIISSSVAAWVLVLVDVVAAIRPGFVQSHIKERLARKHGRLAKRDVDPSVLYPTHSLKVPIDHFPTLSKYEPHVNGTFSLRYWYDDTYYKPGGPVIMLASGETSGRNRLPYLQEGIVYQLSKATGGLGIVLEHRYYGDSFPVPDITNKNLRFLTTEQSLEDTAYFKRHVHIPGLEKDAPWIAYGGSYAGAYVAFLRKLHPDLFWGAIASSGTTHAIYDYWRYYDVIAEYGPKECIATTKAFVSLIDTIVITQNKPSDVDTLKNVFGLANLTSIQDFANLLSGPLHSWQNLNWNPAISDTLFPDYCAAITNDTLVYPNMTTWRPAVEHLIAAAGAGGGYGVPLRERGEAHAPGSATSAKRAPDFEDATETRVKRNLVTRWLNFIGFIRDVWVCPPGYTTDECWAQNSPAEFQDRTLSWDLSWAYQTCDEWGDFQSGSGYPADGQGIISRTIDLPYLTHGCRVGFDINRPPNTDNINKYGGGQFSYPRVAFISGQWDPWKEATPLAEELPRRISTPSEPVIVIEGAVHHWDENGLFPNETSPTVPPGPVKAAQKAEREFVIAWLEEYRKEYGRR